MTDKNKPKGGGGGGAATGRIFISRPSGDFVLPGSDAGKYDITLVLGQAHGAPKFSVAVKVFVDGRQVGLVDVEERKDYAFKGIKLDPAKTHEVKVEKAGFSGEFDSLNIDPSDFKAAGKAATATDKKASRLQVIVSPLTPARFHVATFIVKDKDGNLGPGIVLFCLGQRARVNGANTGADQSLSITIDASGRATANIQLLEADATVAFTLAETGETVLKSLLCEP